MTSRVEKKFAQVTPEHLEREVKQTELLKFAKASQICCVSIIDIVNSTKTTSGITEDKVGTFYSIFLNYVSDVIKNHGGTVVKNIGDSLLYYFTQYKDSNNAIVDSFNCNLDIIEKRHHLNQKLEAERLPTISYRVSSDYGKVFVAVSSISSIDDIFGPTVNMCAKLNHIGKPNTFFIGNDLYLNAKNLNGFDFDEITESKLCILKNPYPAYFVKKT
jgi:class 3 adenylate cyclase